MAKRFKVHLIVPGDMPHSADTEDVEGLYPTRERALKVGIDAALARGLIVVNEVEAEQKVKREWVEVVRK